MSLDRTDKRLLAILQTNGRISNQDLAEQVGLSATPCARRVKRLEDEGFIRGYMALLDAEKLGLNLIAYLSISMDKHTPERFTVFEQAIVAFPEVLECAIVTGQTADFMLKVLVEDMKHYEEFLLQRLTKIKGVSGVHSSFVLRSIIQSNVIDTQR